MATTRSRSGTGGVRFQGTVTLGQLVLLVPLVTLVGTGVGSIWRVSSQYQETRDAIAHETEMRQQVITGLTNEVHALALQQGRDITGLQSAIADLRLDVRTMAGSRLGPLRQ